MRQCGLTAEKRTVEHALQDGAPTFERKLGEGRFVAQRGVVHEDVEPPETGDGFRDQARNIGRLAHIGEDRGRLATRDSISATTAAASAADDFALTTTAAPACANVSAISRPMLRAAPVTSATDLQVPLPYQMRSPQENGRHLHD